MITIKLDAKALSRQLDAFARKQLPFAAAQALNVVARAGIKAEQAAMRADLDRPKPFTANQGLRLLSATKAKPAATIYIPPTQSRYLAPEIEGGAQVLNRGSRAVLRPIDQATDQYGNLPRGLLARLKGRPDIFIGTVTFKRSGQSINGVWQRVVQRSDRHGQRSEFRRRKGGWERRLPDKSEGEARGLRLLIRFADPVQVKTRYPFGQATIATARALFPGELRRQLAAALRTAR
jgi:hypothetical protein